MYIIDFISYLSYQLLEKKMGHKVQNSKNENHEIIDVIFENFPAWKEIKFIFRTHKKMGRVRKQRYKIISKINVERYLFCLL